MDAFKRALGTSQGRLERAAGDVSFVLGDLEPGRRHDLRPGDCVEIAQRADFTGVGLVRLRGSIAVPDGAGAWRVSLRLDGAERAAVACGPGRARALSDLAVVVAGVAVAELAVRLTFVGDE